MNYLVGLTPDGRRADGSALYGDEAVEIIARPGFECVWLNEADVVAGAGAALECDSIVAFGSFAFDGTVVDRLPRLRHVARFGAGFDAIGVAELGVRGVAVTTTPSAVREPLALSGLTLLLALAHRLPENYAGVAAGRWSETRGTRRGIGIGGRTVGIVGFGAVGSRFAEMVNALGSDVIAYDPLDIADRAAQVGVEVVTLPQLAERADFVVVTAALTESSRGVIDGAFIHAMRTSAYLVNIARGGLVDQTVLREALIEGRIAGAGLDVLDPEPPAPDEPLLSLPNVICTPHSLCWTSQFTQAVATEVAVTLVECASGRLPRSVVNGGHLSHWRGLPNAPSAPERTEPDS